MISHKFKISDIFLYCLAISMCMRFFSFGIPATTFPFILGIIVCLVVFSVYRFEFNIIILIALLLTLALLHSLLTNHKFDHVIKLFSLSLIFYSSRLLLCISRNPIGLFNNIILLNILFLLLEMFGRIFFGDHFRSEESTFVESDSIDVFFLVGFYKFKLGSPFFLDSNFAAIHGFILLLSMVRLKKFITIYDLKLFTLIIIILLTFSRAAIICLLIFLFFLSLQKYSAKTQISIYSLLLVLIFLFALWLLDDWSLQTKFSVWERFFGHDFDVHHLFFGYGVGDGKYIFGWEEGFTSHSLIPSIVGEFGFLGLSIFFVALYSIANNFSTKRWVFFILILLLGFSLYDPLEPLLFFFAGLSKTLRLGGSCNSLRQRLIN